MLKNVCKLVKLIITCCFYQCVFSTLFSQMLLCKTRFLKVDLLFH